MPAMTPRFQLVQQKQQNAPRKSAWSRRVSRRHACDSHDRSSSPKALPAEESKDNLGDRGIEPKEAMFVEGKVVLHAPEIYTQDSGWTGSVRIVECEVWPGVSMRPDDAPRSTMPSTLICPVRERQARRIRC